MTEQIRVATVDDHPIFQEGLQRILGRLKPITLVGQGASAEDACRIAAVEEPDVMLLDITMPGNGIEAARTISSKHPRVKVIVLTASEDDERVSEAMAAGALGFLVKGVMPSELLTAITTVRDGQPYIQPQISTRILFRNLGSSREAQPAHRRAPDLLPHEQEVMALLNQGLTNKEIADRLGLALSTVKNRLTRVFQKLQVQRRTQALRAWKRE